MSFHRFGPMKIPLVESVTIDRQPSQQGVELCQGMIDSPTKLGQRPAGSDMDHVSMGFAWPRQEPLQSVAPPRGEQVEQVEAHTGSFKGKPTQIQIDCVERGSQQIRTVLLQGGVIALEEDPPDLFESQSNKLLPAVETSTGE